jgi:hypothetical protein
MRVGLKGVPDGLGPEDFLRDAAGEPPEVPLEREFGEDAYRGGETTDTWRRGSISVDATCPEGLDPWLREARDALGLAEAWERSPHRTVMVQGHGAIPQVREVSQGSDDDEPPVKGLGDP